MKKTTLMALLVPALIAVLALNPFKEKKARFHSEAELAYFHKTGIDQNSQTFHNPAAFLPIDSNILFPTAKTCGGCHGHDPNGFALVSNSGVDVNIYDDWRSTMMANSARDPFWRAKVTHEILISPAHSNELQDKCTSCHAPAGHYQAKLKRHEEFYTLSDLYTDTLGLDGVTCQACHAQPAALLGTTNSGILNFDTNHIRIAYGPYEFFFAPPMHEFVGITPVFSPHIADAGLCAGCHTLITNSADLQGNLTGNTFIEQATYHEWLNSRYDEDHNNISCQACHIPQLQDEVIISANYQFLTPKYPFGIHELAGANVAMLRLMKENRNALGITAGAEQFDSTIAATLRMLQHKSVQASLTPVLLQGDTMKFDLALLNKAGHKFPSGYPSRRAWVELEVTDANGNTLFHSGAMNPDYSLPDEDPNFEPHYNVIRESGQVQIYELVPGDVLGNFTNVLERCDVALKDNRLVPQGFSLNDPVYDTTQIVGIALQDPDFNLAETGTDVVHFHIPNNGYEGALTVRARLWYQTLPPKWMAPMFEYSSPEIDSFKLMFEAADRSPVLVAESLLQEVYVTPVSSHTPVQTAVKIWPTLSRDGLVQISSAEKLTDVKVWDSKGRLVWNRVSPEIRLPDTPGVYLVAVEAGRQRKVVKVVRM